MQPGTLPHRRAGAIALAALALACALALAPASAWPAPPRPGAGDLSARLAELAKPAIRAAPPESQAKALSLAAEGPGSLLREGNRVLVEARFDHGAAAGAEDLRAAGAKVLNISPRYQTITIAAKPSELPALSAIPRLESATEVLAPITYESACPAGAATSEGDAQLHADAARLGPPELDGSGVKVGVLSDSFATATEAAAGGAIATEEADDVASGDLPGTGNTCLGQETPVENLEDYEPALPSDPEPTDEGRAMAQIVHDLAPGADIAFASAFTGLTAFAENVEELAKPAGEGGAGARVIVDDVAYFEEPFFQEGPVGSAVSNAATDGASYFSSAGNNNLIDSAGRNIASWEAKQFRDAGSCPAAVATLSSEFEQAEGSGLAADHCMDFNPGPDVDTTFGISVANGRTLLIDLQWAEPWEGVGTDIDAFLIAPSGSIQAFAIADNPGNGRPFELLSWKNNTGSTANVQLVLNRYGGGAPRVKFGLLQNGSGVSAIEYPESKGGDIVGPTIFGHNGAEDAVSVGAIHRNATTAPEPYSSRGPVTHHFGPVEGVTPAPALTPARVLSKPDLTATDCVATTFFSFEAGGGTWRFCGTSAAAPHAAAVAALMLERKPSAEPAEIRSALTGSTAPIGTSASCSIGAGLIDAVAAIALLDSGEPGDPHPPCEPPESSPWIVIGQGNTTPTEIPVADDEAIPTGGPAGATNPPRRSDESNPHTFFRHRPPGVIRTRHRTARVVFRFGSNEEGVTFRCQWDSRRYRKCSARFVRRFGLGRHVLRVKARDAAGNADRTPAMHRFRVKRVGRSR